MRAPRSARSIALLSCLASGAVLASLAACSGEDEIVAPNTDAGGAARIAADTGVEWVIEMDPSTNTASLAYPKMPVSRVLAPGQDAAAVSSSFLVKYPEVFGVVHTQDLVTEAVEVDPSGVTHVRLVQTANGVPVPSAVLQVHFDVAGGIDHVTGPFYPTLAAAAARTPVVTTAAATQTAIGIVRGQAGTNATISAAPVVTEVRIVQGAPVLVHVVPLTVDGFAWEVWVDVVTGQYARVLSLARTETASGAGIRSTRTFEIDAPVGGRYRMIRTGSGNRPTLQIHDVSVNGPLYSSADKDKWEADDVDPLAKGLAVEAFYKMGMVEGWYRGLGWSSFDGKRSPIRIEAFTTLLPPRNAFFSGDITNPYFGITIGRMEGSQVVPPSTSMETMAHELTHAVFAFTTGIQSNCEEESGAFDEALGDIFGALVTSELASPGDPLIHGDEFGPLGISRSLRDPAFRQSIRPETAYVGVDHVDGKTGECHADGGIVDLAWYLMTYGGPHPEPTRGAVTAGLGMGLSKDLWWTLLRYEMRGAKTFRDLAKRTMLVSRYKKMPREAVGCAWKAVGVLSAAELEANYSITCPESADAGSTDAAASADSCAGREDGLYCSTLDPRVGFQCRGGSFAGAEYCLQGERCAGASEDGELMCTGE